MTKQEFTVRLRSRLAGLPAREVDERVRFYVEMIDDRIEDGAREADAVAELGSVETIASQIISDIPLSKIAKEKIKPKHRLRTWEIVLIVLGSPIWLSLVIAAFAVVISLYAVLWSVVVSLWAVFAALAGSAFGGVFAGVTFACCGYVATGLVTVGAAIVCAGLAIFFFFGCLHSTKGAAVLAKKIVVGIKRCFVRKERV